MRDSVAMLDGPFLGSAAIAAGVLTRAELRIRFLPIFRDVYVPRDWGDDLVERALAANLLLPPDGALGGFAAAALHGAPCGPRNTPVEVVAPRGDVGRRRGLVVRQAALDPADVCIARDCMVTTPLRTAYDLGRRLALVEAVVAIDALARVGGFTPRALLGGPVGARGCRRLRDAVGLAEPEAESLMETRLRLVLVLAGLPAPVVQYRIRDAAGSVRARVDLAYPDARLALEYDGEHHFDPEFSVRDRRRDLHLDGLDWHTMRFTADDVRLTPQDTVRRVEYRLRARLP